MFLFKRWCSSICPLGFFFGLMGKLRAARLQRPPSGRLRHLHLEGGLPNLFHRVPRGHRRGGSRQGDAGGLHLLPRLRGELPHEVHQGRGGGREADTRLFRRAFRR
ncbi:MAG: 4Fe-4S binding protein [Eggerthellaceae bacterium]